MMRLEAKTPQRESKNRNTDLPIKIDINRPAGIKGFCTFMSDDAELQSDIVPIRWLEVRKEIVFDS